MVLDHVPAAVHVALAMPLSAKPALQEKVTTSPVLPAAALARPLTGAAIAPHAFAVQLDTGCHVPSAVQVALGDPETVQPALQL